MILIFFFRCMEKISCSISIVADTKDRRDFLEIIIIVEREMFWKVCLKKIKNDLRVTFIYS